MSTPPTTVTTAVAELQLLSWRREVFALYRGARAASDPRSAWRAWRDGRDNLFRHHPQTPLAGEDVPAFEGLGYFPYDPAYRVLAHVAADPGQPVELTTSTGEPMRFHRFAQARFRLAGEPLSLPLYWLEGYGGGVFLPFADATSGADTYGAGRYLLDSVKGADLGNQADGLVLDFNFAYNPSCAYRATWTCPLPSPGSRLPVAVRAGELAPPRSRH